MEKISENLGRYRKIVPLVILWSCLFFSSTLAQDESGAEMAIESPPQKISYHSYKSKKY